MFNRRRRFGGKFNGGKSSHFRSRGRFGGSAKSKGLNPLMFVKKAVEVNENEYVPQFSFSDFDLDELVKKNIADKGFVNPSAIQDQAIPTIIKGRDLVGIANTGTGKTAAFLLPLISKVNRNRQEKVLILAPTRELAMQIREELFSFNKGMGIYSALCIGGASMGRQIGELSRNPNFVIGTPGRIKDLMTRKHLVLNRFNNVVLDEFDRMLDMGFVKEVRMIVDSLDKKRQTLLFSATLPEEIKRIIREMLVDPITVSVKTASTSDNVDQDIIRTQGKDKVDYLHELLAKEEFKKVLVFGRTKWGVSKLEQKLLQKGIRAASIHGQKTQGQRQRALEQLKRGEVQVLVATDVASRGIDVSDISHVINFDLPETYEDYIHRIGRTGRAGKKGVSLTFVD